MHITALEEYGLRCALQLARAHQKGQIATSQIADAEGISVEYVSKLTFLFRKAGLVQSSRGIQGGFRLVRDPSEISLKQILDAVQGKKRSSGDQFCEQFRGKKSECVHSSGCSVRPVWALVSSYFDRVMADVTLADLMADEMTTRTRMESVVAAQSAGLKAKLVENSKIQRGTHG